jgi:hypothetical protein
MTQPQPKFILRMVIGVLALLGLSCNAPRAAFPPGTEFGSQLLSDLELDPSQPSTVKLVVDYPEEFHGSVIDGVVSSNPNANVITLAVNSLQREGTRICVRSEIAAVANSRGERSSDDSGTVLAVENYTPQTTTLISSQVCTGQAEQQTCMPMTVPITTPGPTSMFIRAQVGRGIRLHRQSLVVLRLTDGLCSPAPGTK